MSLSKTGNGDADLSDGLMPLRVVSFWDGRRGHESQTRGVLRALAKVTDIAVESQLVYPLSGAQRIWSGLSFCALMVRPTGRKTGATPPDLIIGTGSTVHIPMLLLKKQYPQARVVTCMTPDFPLRGWMDLCFVPRHDRHKRRDNIFETIGPPNNFAYADTHDPRRVLILVGGLDPKRHDWDSATLMEQIQTLAVRSPDCRWTISSSPRTPSETLAKLEKLALRNRGIKFHNVQNTPDGWIERQYLQNMTVWVTSDSVSMVYEALTAGCRVGILPVRWRRRDNKFQQGLDFLAANNYVTLYDAWLKTGRVAAAGLRLDEASRCAQELLRRWWPSRLR